MITQKNDCLRYWIHGNIFAQFLLQFVILFRAHFVSQQILYKFSGKKYDNIHHLQIIPIFYEKKTQINYDRN